LNEKIKNEDGAKVCAKWLVACLRALGEGKERRKELKHKYYIDEN
jgi:hypothetical protein